MSAEKFVVGNFKGGVGKSTAVQMLSFESAFVHKQKTLVIDLDMQGNTSDVLNLTHMNYSIEEGGGAGVPLEFEYTINDVLMYGVPAEEATYQIINNLDVIPANIAFEMFDDWVKSKYQTSLEQFKYIEERLSPLFDKYDRIYLDVPPSISIYSKAAMYIAEWVIVILQTQVKSMRNGIQYMEYMEYFTEQFDTSLKVIGVIPFMLESGDAVDIQMYKEAKDIYQQHLLKTVVLKNARLKRYDGSGISLEKTSRGKIEHWDKRAHTIFLDIYDELEEHKKWFN
ncbi:ParA family protein [Enterococcus sp. CSURQ0835]|uniref:ParA family protein n=1 Tax=Enterococcus sp. CSURQ0835 TaxID=2681394 RepID=UPI00135C391F|nr:ParA family protein [Enterococcus sp. CSURQ0835]